MSAKQMQVRKIALNRRKLVFLRCGRFNGTKWSHPVFDDSTCLQALLESGSPSEQSREVLAHQRLRSVTSNKVAMLPVNRPPMTKTNSRDYKNLLRRTLLLRCRNVFRFSHFCFISKEPLG